MPEEILGNFEVRRLGLLDEEGNADEALMPSVEEADIKRIYETIVLARTFDGRALSLQREGRLGTYASILGQEASQVASAFAAEKTDWIFPTYRESGVFVAVGYPLRMLFQYWAGDERGMKIPDAMNIFPICIPVGTHIPHAVGMALASKLKGDPASAIVYFGDGATSKGDFHEGLNIAGVFKAPVVFICQNNQWAISVPRKMQSAAETLAQKAVAYGFTGVQVDGNDVFAVYKATKEALEKAKRGEGPTLIECFTYRLSDHTTADDATRYRDPAEVEAWKMKDPVRRLELYMQKRNLLTEDSAREIAERAKQTVDEAVREAESIEPPNPEEIFAYTFKTSTARLAKEIRSFSRDGR